MIKKAGILAGILLLALFPRAVGQKSGPGDRGLPHSVTAAPSASVQVNRDFGRVPLSFIPNNGQLDERVAFLIQGRDKTVYFSPGGLTFLLGERGVEPAETKAVDSAGELPVNSPSPAKSWVVKLDFVGARRDVRPVGEEATGGVVSYFKGKPEEWKTGLPTYSRIVYRELWPGIDLAYSGTVNRLKYEFVVHPGADPKRIRLAYRGVDDISVDKEGRLEVRTPAGGLKDDIPIAYQESAGGKESVALKYRVDAGDQGSAGMTSERPTWERTICYGFEVGEYDPARTLVLDPAFLIFSGFIGGYWNDWGGTGIAVDASGSAYVTGYTNSPQSSFPETVGPDLTYNGNIDAFIAKVDASGASLVYCGYIGGDQDDRGLAVAVDSAGNAYVTGSTSSTQATFPVLAGYDMTHNGLNDAFVAKVNASGSALVYCTYIGGSANDYGYGIAVDGTANAYIAGYTGSNEATFCEITGPDITYNGGNWDAFVCKLNSSGTGRYYCGYIGGSEDDFGRGIAVDGSGNAYLTGYTWSHETTFPVTVGPDLTYNGSQEEAFVAKVNSSGTALSYCGYIGGSGPEFGYGIALDSKGCAYVVGRSSWGGMPTVIGPDLSYGGGGDAFVAKVSSSGDKLLYCGYLGGSDTDEGIAVAVDEQGCAYLTGYTQSSNDANGFPILDFPKKTVKANNGFIAKVNASGTRFLYSGIIGGWYQDIFRGVAVDGWGNAYITGSTQSFDFPTLVGPDLTFNSESEQEDALVAKIGWYQAPVQTLAAGDFDGDGVEEAVVDFGTTGAWMYDGGIWTQLSAMNPQGMIKANIDGDAADELFIEFGYAGLWLWNAGVMDLLSEEDVETMAAGDVDGDASDELAVDFGTVGLWLWNGGSWTQLSGANVELLAVAQLDGSGGAELVGDFGAIGLWLLSGGSWTQLSGVNLQSMATANTDGIGGRELVGDFGPVGLWLYHNGTWEQWSGVNADSVIAADIDGNGDDEVFGDFALTGLWLWNGGTWTIFSGLNVDDMIAADTDGDGADELVADFEAIGIWHWDGGSWNQISGADPENMIAGDIDGDGADEVFADFGTLGLWLWNGGVWSQVSAGNPE